MKFQNPSLNFFLNGRTHARTHKPKAICSPLFQSWGHNQAGILELRLIDEMLLTALFGSISRALVKHCAAFVCSFIAVNIAPFRK